MRWFLKKKVLHYDYSNVKGLIIAEDEEHIPALGPMPCFRLFLELKAGDQKLNVLHLGKAESGANAEVIAETISQYADWPIRRIVLKHTEVDWIE